MSKEHGPPLRKHMCAGSHSFSISSIREETIKKSNKKLLMGWEKCLQMWRWNFIKERTGKWLYWSTQLRRTSKRCFCLVAVWGGKRYLREVQAPDPIASIYGWTGVYGAQVAQPHELAVLNPKFCQTLNHKAKTFLHSGLPSLTRGQSKSPLEGFPLASGAAGQGHSIAVTCSSLEKYQIAVEA